MPVDVPVYNALFVITVDYQTIHYLLLYKTHNDHILYNLSLDSVFVQICLLSGVKNLHEYRIQ